MKRREFVTLIGGAAVSWPLAARAQQVEGVRRIGVLMNTSAKDTNAVANLADFTQALQQLGWTAGQNIRIESRWGGGNAERNSQIRSGIGRACT